MRRWFDKLAEYVYRPRTTGEDPYTEFPDLRIGLVHELAKATNGIAVIFDHRYYGSNPVKPVDYLKVHLPSTHTTSIDKLLTRGRKDFRFLSVEQAMADQAYFAQNVVFPGLEDYKLTVPNTPWFAIGGSYPGAFTAWIK